MEILAIFIIFVKNTKMRLIKILLTIIICASSLFSFTQIQYDFGFKRDFSVSAFDSSGNVIKFAWAGGLNAAQFNQIDLNIDGIKDLLIFDKIGNHKLTFLNGGSSGISDYSYDYTYQKLLPDFNGWVNFIDFNCDGKEDIFAYTVGGIKVFQNISDTALKFKIFTPLLNSYQGSGYSNILVTDSDYPAFTDIDNDGDIDVLVFFGLGTFVEYHQNMSMEYYGNCDSLKLIKKEYCWGNFAESSTTNHIILNINCPWRCDSLNNINKDGTRHTGSTMLAGDFNGDNIKDLLLGDVDFFNLTLLNNGGTTDSAHIVSVDSVFPANTVMANIISFPAPFMMDINNDSKKELLISSFEPSTIKQSGINSCWLYNNSGSNNNPVFNFNKKDFIQGDMIETANGAYPVFFDYDFDGKTDLLVSNYGYLDSSYYHNGYLYGHFRSKISLYENSGTISSPEFKLITRDFADLSALNKRSLYPTFGDINYDGKPEMITGDSSGKLCVFIDNAPVGQPVDFVLSACFYQGIDVGSFSTPQLFDLNGDSLLDLSIGKMNGFISYYQNTGTKFNPIFTKITDSLGKVDVTNHFLSYNGFSVPTFFKDNSGKIKLFVGSESGNIFYYKDIENNLNGKFTRYDSILVNMEPDSVTRKIRDGMRSSSAVFDLNNDGYFDMITGNYSGGLTYYKGIKPQPYDAIDDFKEITKSNIRIYPNPAKNSINIEIYDISNLENVELSIFSIIGKLEFFKKYYSERIIINASDFNNGIYIINLRIKEKEQISSFNYKIIINH
jgi:hypothetical protein